MRACSPFVSRNRDSAEQQECAAREPKVLIDQTLPEGPSTVQALQFGDPSQSARTGRRQVVIGTWLSWGGPDPNPSVPERMTSVISAAQAFPTAGGEKVPGALRPARSMIGATAPWSFSIILRETWRC